MRIGFIGLGIMGKPMAKNLIKAGYSLVVNDINKEAVAELVASGAAEAASAKEVASQSDVVVTMLPNSPHVQTVVLGEGGVIEGAKEGLVVVDMSSISPIVSREVAAELAKKGVVMLDAPVSGGEPKAIDGTLAIMVGGPEETFKVVEPILQVMGGSVTLVGEIGSGNTTKLANQIMVAANIAGMSEALVLATKADVDPEKVFKAIRGGLAGSTVLDAKAPLVLDGNFKPGFRIDLHIKDLQNALDTAATVKTPTPL
ncbi:MAG: 2-hydroxy-3-oxopropionate reductase, partial [Sphaerochaetaceae bacterium]|nr:2-hydroxy-3-oxopropionate reductase [Sphaerochaetaceae bacterium]